MTNKDDMPDVIACLIADEFPDLFDMEGNDYARQHKLENVAAKIQSHIDELTRKHKTDLFNQDQRSNEVLGATIEALNKKHEAELKAQREAFVKAIGEIKRDKDLGHLIDKGTFNMMKDLCKEAILNAVKKHCYQCDAEVDYLFADSRCGKCTRLTVDEVTGGE